MKVLPRIPPGVERFQIQAQVVFTLQHLPFDGSAFSRVFHPAGGVTHAIVVRVGRVRVDQVAAQMQQPVTLAGAQPVQIFELIKGFIKIQDACLLVLGKNGRRSADRPGRRSPRPTAAAIRPLPAPTSSPCRVSVYTSIAVKSLREKPCAMEVGRSSLTQPAT